MRCVSDELRLALWRDLESERYAYALPKVLRTIRTSIYEVIVAQVCVVAGRAIFEYLNVPWNGSIGFKRD